MIHHPLQRIAYLVTVLASIATIIPAVQCQEKLSAQNPCVSKINCHECIQTRGCAWCMDPDFGDKPRCFQPSSVSLIGGCKEEYTHNPDNEQQLLISEQLTRAGMLTASGAGMAAGSAHGSAHAHGSASASGSWGASGHQSIVQISPQRVGLKLRISTSGFIYFSYNLFNVICL